MSGLNVDTINDSSGGNTATINGIPLRPGVLDPENRIINGAFDFWQRGTSTSTTNTFGADRWAHLFSGGAATQSRQSFSIGDTLGTNNPTYFLRQSVTGQSAAGNYANVTQRIEGVATYAGQTITVLGWARRSSGTGNMSIDTFQYFGTGGSPSATTSQTAQVVTLSGSWSPFAATFSLPSVSGKTLGTNLNDFLGIRIWSSAGTSFSSIGIAAQTIDVDLWGVHIKVGTHTTAAVDLYRQPELGPELERCKRYYNRAATKYEYRGYASSGGDVIYVPVVITPMRGAPSRTQSNVVSNSNTSAVSLGMGADGVGFIQLTTIAAGMVSSSLNIAYDAEL